MNKKTSFFFIGIINTCTGILGFIYGEIFIRHWHSVNKFESIIWILSGIIFFYASNKEKQEKYTKCPKCKEVYNYEELEKGKCKNCEDVDTIELKEYYKNYSEEGEDDK